MEFKPNYNNLVKASLNKKADRIPLYEHLISIETMEEILEIKFGELINGNSKEKTEYFRLYNMFFQKMGYDTVSFEVCIGEALINAGGLLHQDKGAIKNMDDFLKYPWVEIEKRYFDLFSENYKCMDKSMPEGMKAVGGPGNGLFELVQDLVGFTTLCYISIDDPELYKMLFQKVGELQFKIWSRFLKEFGDIYCVCRFGDDLGFKTQTLLPNEDIRKYIIPQYKRIIDLVHSYNKPFLLHSCGCIFNVMDEIIEIAGIDVKHSNEDEIAPFSTWVDKYGDRIGLFGGVDTDHLCRKSEVEIKRIVEDVMIYSHDKCGFALGSGNSIPAYVPIEGFVAMIESGREMREKLK